MGAEDDLLPSNEGNARGRAHAIDVSPRAGGSHANDCSLGGRTSTACEGGERNFREAEADRFLRPRERLPIL